jgi:predicted TIM-barrel fold metal-dependent hydrolase
MRGLCERFSRLNFVSVESGFGYVPFLLEAMDWQYKNNRASQRGSLRLLPSEYFRRQVYATFWFESYVDRLIDLLPDNVMFESDYPHPTSLSPGPGSRADDARTTIARNLAGLPEEIRRKVLHDTAARVYHLEV